MPPWKHRRRLIYGTCILAAAMIVYAALTHKSDTQVGTQLIVGGVALLSITLTAYTAFATYEDMKLWKVKDEVAEELYSDKSQDTIYSEEENKV